MPRRKKNGQSPARVPAEEGSLGHSAGYRTPQAHDGDMANNFPSSTSLPSSVKENIVKSMQEMFSHLDPEVIYIVLSEFDFKVDNAMDHLLELSEAAEVAPPLPPLASGFERTAAELLSSHNVYEPRPDPVPSNSNRMSSPLLPTSILTEELDLLIDQELKSLTAQSDSQVEHFGSQYLSGGPPLSSFPPPPIPQQALPELLQSSMETGATGPYSEEPCLTGSLVKQTAGASSPLDQLSLSGVENFGAQQSVVDFTHLTSESATKKKPTPALDLAASGRPSAFQVYKKQDSPHTLLERTGMKPSEEIVGGARCKTNMTSQEMLGRLPSPWNLAAPEFCPQIDDNQSPTFITPVAQTSSNWASHVGRAARWSNPGTVSQAPLKPSATVPRSWTLPVAPQLTTPQNRLRLEGRVLVLLRGAPGSGKSTLARVLLEHNPGGVALSTDDYFSQHGEYHFDPALLGEAHGWNHKRAKEACEAGVNPIIIDNTNTQGWEMRPYVVQGLKHKYKMLFREPDTWWKNKPRELERRCTRGVPVETIRRMLNAYERYVTVHSIMGSHTPERKQLLLDGSSSQPMSSETPHPDIVGESALTDGCKKSHPQLFSSLPDVSSIGHSGEMERLEESAHNSAESLEKPEPPDGDYEGWGDLGSLDSELEAQFEQNPPSGDQGIPDCIVESVLNEDHHADEIPVAFSESIGQRVRRERVRKSADLDNLESADLVKHQSEKGGERDEEMRHKGVEGVDMVRDRDKGMPELLDFVGDWPTEGSLEQRRVRRRQRRREQNQNEDGAPVEEADRHKNTKKVRSGPGSTEFQKLLDLIQTGVAAIQTGSSNDSSLSPSSGEEGEREGEAGNRSNSEDREEDRNKVKSRKIELPDCVLDWKAAEACVVKEPPDMRMSDLEGTETGGGGATGERNNALEMGRETDAVDLVSRNLTSSLPVLSADLLVSSETVEAKVCHDAVGGHIIIGDESGADHTDAAICTESGSLTESRSEIDGVHVDRVCHSPACDTSGEGECTFTGGSLHRRQRQGRRSGKSCKLALTFTQNCPSSLETPEGVELHVNPSCASSLNPKPDFDLITDPTRQPSPETPVPPVDTSGPTQTEPQDFALLWRLNRSGNSEETVISACPGDIMVLSCDASRFVPQQSCPASAAVAVQPSGHREVPYRVVHEKGTQVEEKEFGAPQGRLESLSILSCHFKLVSFDTLEDLYDKCHQDLEWTTNLLLDSGERFFREEDCEVEREMAGALIAEHNKPRLGGDLDVALDTRSCSTGLDLRPEDVPKTGSAHLVTQESIQETVNQSDEHSDNTDLLVTDEGHTDTALHDLIRTVKERDRCVIKHKLTSETDLEGGAWGGSLNDTEAEDDMSSMDEIHRLLQAELEELDREGAQKKESTERRHWEERRRPLDIQSVELQLPTELALQLTELFGPVGVDPGSCSSDDYAVQMDLNTAKLLHQKWKDTIQERQRQATLSYHLLQESSVHWGESQANKMESREQPAHFLVSTDGYASANNQSDACGDMPFMDHWSVSRPHVSLRDIIKEEQALQENMKKTRQSRVDLDRRDGATLLRESQLYDLFPFIDKHFLQDIFRDHNYNFTQTELFLRSLLDEGPVKTVVAPELPRSDHLRTASREREKRQKPVVAAASSFQDRDDPQYDDFRAEANLQRDRRLENFAKAAEAFKQGRKEVASFYAQQGHLHGHRMREANHRAAAQIFERVNTSLLPNNILDLHGLHVDEALQHLAQVLHDKTTELERGLCRPQLSIITGRGNHSQGGVARIRPAVIDYLTNKQYRFTEPKPGLVLVSLK
ncbi:NEDD4-binding protein 2 [Genypterus blacodes]|uniref:NEDD4-binding protein 2 n=1 Tax=Genypterus blacodes TaxID=154954 RepID=UPI003F76AB7D